MRKTAGMTRRMFTAMSSAFVLTGFVKHGGGGQVGYVVIDDLGNLVVDDIGNQVVAS